jgi:hypothetical protein
MRRKEKEENLIVVCLADRASYLDSLLHTTTLVRSTSSQQSGNSSFFVIFRRFPFRSVAIGILIAHFSHCDVVAQRRQAPG